jgi:hypothetical protein
MQVILSETEYEQLKSKEKELEEIKNTINSAVKVEYAEKTSPMNFGETVVKKVTLDKKIIEALMIGRYE